MTAKLSPTGDSLRAWHARTDEPANCSITTMNMRTILYTTGTINCESGVDHRWRIKTLHDSIEEATVCGNYSMSLDNCPADGYVIVAIEDCNHIVQSLLPGNVSFLPELGAFK